MEQVANKKVWLPQEWPNQSKKKLLKSMKKKIDNRSTVTALGNAIERQEIHKADHVRKFFKGIIDRTDYGTIEEETILITKVETLWLNYPNSNIRVDLEYYSLDGTFSDECDSITVKWIGKDGEIKDTKTFG